ncbi:GDP-mannose 4,6-dehydratase [Enterococcus plantarum]|uniref:GDP-mannose 4,6-dehydratase n=1 Tax=Enterococcus plantarum TaxID=1077675 RepID=UPI0030F86E07
MWKIIHDEKSVGKNYNIGDYNVMSNLQLIEMILKILSEQTQVPIDIYQSLISFVEDRKGHDFRYAIDSSKIASDLKWQAKTPIKDGLLKTVKFYLNKYSNRKENY